MQTASQGRLGTLALELVFPPFEERFSLSAAILYVSLLVEIVSVRESYGHIFLDRSSCGLGSDGTAS